MSGFNSLCPVTGEEIWRGEESDSELIAECVAKARLAQELWGQLGLEARTEYLKSFQNVLEAEKESLSLAIAKDAGKPLWEARTEVAAMIAKIDVSIESYNQRTGESLSQSLGVQTSLIHKPHGVVVVLGPYNFPGHLPNGQIVPALLAGNTVIFKPSEQTPLVGEMLLKCFDKAGFPSSVVNLLQGGGGVGKALLAQDIDGVFFTGSYTTGRKIHQSFAGRPEVILALEMGGNNPLIVDEVSDIAAAVYHTIMSAFITAGQRCTCARRLLVPNSPWGERFTDALTKQSAALTVGGYNSNPEAFMGAVISTRVSKQLLEEQNDLIYAGGQALLKIESLGQALLSPGIIDVTDIKGSLLDEEIFGPLLQIIRYDDFNQAVGLANQTAYGLSAGLLTDNAAHAQTFYGQIRAGIVNINRPLTGASSKAPFGGVGKSGNQRPAAFYAADFCAYPMASMSSTHPVLPENLPLGYNKL